ncbi:unnamed protein product [Closterium sp. Naga37s-1]|nr:unnamed protein product [Closterium sp. Naga37s-1]
MAVPSQRTLRVVCILLLVALPCLVEAARKKKKGDTPPLPSVRFYKSTVKVSYAGVAKIPSTATQGAAVQSRQVLENPRSQIGGRRLLEDDSIDLGTPGTDPSATDPAVEDGEPNLDFDPRPLLPPAELTGATAVSTLTFLRFMFSRLSAISFLEFLHIKSRLGFLSLRLHAAYANMTVAGIACAVAVPSHSSRTVDNSSDILPRESDLEAAKKKKPKAFLSLTVAPFSPSVLKSGVTAKQTASTGTAAYASDSSVPDPSVCAGSNYVVQVVNWAIVVFDGSGKALTAPVALNEFLGVNPYRGTTVGDLVTKASCVYDSATKRFFLSAAWLVRRAALTRTTSSARRARTTRASRAARASSSAVSAAEKPLDAWSVYFVGTTNDGTNGPDDHLAPLAYTGELFYNTYPRLGVDANGVYVTTQQATYSNVDDVWQGSNIFVRGHACVGLCVYASSTFVHLLPLILHPFLAIPPSPSLAFSSLYSPPNSAFSKAALLKQSDITAVRFALPAHVPARIKRSSTVFAFALTNTVSLSANNPTLTLLTAIANCSFYYDWSTSQQKPGLAPLAESYNKDTPLIVPPRSTSVALSTGFLWMVVPTGSTMSPNSEAGFMLVKMKATVAKGPSPALNLAVASAMIYNVPMANLIAPTIAFNKLGKGIILATLVSPNNYPTVGFVRVTKAGISPKDLKFYTVVQSSAPLDVDSQSEFPAFSKVSHDLSVETTATLLTVPLHGLYPPHSPQSLLISDLSRPAFPIPITDTVAFVRYSTTQGLESYSAKSTDPVAFVRYGTTQALAVDATGTVWAAGQYATEERTTRNNWATSLFSVTP